MPLSTHVLRVVWRNVIITGHNFLILPLLFIVLSKPVAPVALLAIPGLILVTINAAWIMVILAVVCTRFRDLTQIVQNAMQVMFYATPIVWHAKMLPERLGVSVLNFNPFYHLLSVVREPLLAEAPTALNWMVSILMAIIGWVLALAFFNRFRKRIPYWL